MQVEQWSPELLKDFWQRFYFPANATLYVVGDLERGVEGTEAVIRDTFGRIPARTLPALPPADTAPAADTEAPAQALLKQRDAVRSCIFAKDPCEIVVSRGAETCTMLEHASTGLLL